MSLYTIIAEPGKFVVTVPSKVRDNEGFVISNHRVVKEFSTREEAETFVRSMESDAEDFANSY